MSERPRGGYPAEQRAWPDPGGRLGLNSGAKRQERKK
jgi:hypothetical protein